MARMSGRYFGNMILGSLWWFNVSIWKWVRCKGILETQTFFFSLFSLYYLKHSPHLINFIHVNIKEYILKASWSLWSIWEWWGIHCLPVWASQLGSLCFSSWFVFSTWCNKRLQLCCLSNSGVIFLHFPRIPGLFESTSLYANVWAREIEREKFTGFRRRLFVSFLLAFIDYQLCATYGFQVEICPFCHFFMFSVTFLWGIVPPKATWLLWGTTSCNYLLHCTSECFTHSNELEFSFSWTQWWVPDLLQNPNKVSQCHLGNQVWTLGERVCVFSFSFWNYGKNEVNLEISRVAVL